jgi:hypothetical protein
VVHMCSQHAATTTIYIDKVVIESNGLGTTAQQTSFSITDSTTQYGSGAFLCLGVELFYNTNLEHESS